MLFFRAMSTIQPSLFLRHQAKGVVQEPYVPAELELEQKVPKTSETQLFHRKE